MEDKQLIDCAIELNSLLQKHQKAEQQLLCLDSYIRNLSGRIFASHLEEQGALHGNFLHRRSVALSIKQVYQTLKDNTFSRIQTLSHRIACILQPGAQAPIDNLPIDLVTSLTDRDDLVQELTRTFCIARRSA
ncbi:uncharacterized protein LOC144620006 [Crassostrea virginica]